MWNALPPASLCHQVACLHLWCFMVILGFSEAASVDTIDSCLYAAIMEALS